MSIELIGRELELYKELVEKAENRFEEFKIDVLKLTDKYLLSPGKTNLAGLKPVFSNSSNTLRKGENHTVTTEHHMEFPYFIKTLPKSGLKNNLKEYKNILKTFLRTDRQL